jgi:hypothetical protein
VLIPYDHVIQSTACCSSYVSAQKSAAILFNDFVSLTDRKYFTEPSQDWNNYWQFKSSDSTLCKFHDHIYQIVFGCEEHLFNPLMCGDNYIYHQRPQYNFCILPTQCIYVFHSITSLSSVPGAAFPFISPLQP